MNSATTPTTQARTSTSDIDTGRAPSRTLEVPSVGQVRVDAHRRFPKPPRADILRAYADWLSDQPADSAQRPMTSPRSTVTEPPAPSSPSLSPEPHLPSPENSNALYYRIDVSPETPSKSIEGISRSPHFETRNYVPPVADTLAAPGADSPPPSTPVAHSQADLVATLSERDREDASAHSGPAAGVRNHIRELQASGRLIGDLRTTRMLEPHRTVPPVQRTVHGKPLSPAGRPKARSPRRATSHWRIDDAPPSGPTTAPEIEASDSRSTQPGTSGWPAVTDALLSNHRPAIETLGREVIEGLAVGRNRIAVTSTRRREGCTTIAMTLARWLASQAKRVLLVDADLTHPDLQSLTGDPLGRSWSNAIEQSLTPKSIAHPSPDPSIEVVPLGQISDNTGWSRPMLDRLGEWLGSANTEYDVILINVGPVFQLVAELSHTDRLFDTAVLVNAINRTTIDERTQSQNGLLAAGVLRLIVAQNFAPEPHDEPGLTG